MHKYAGGQAAARWRENLGAEAPGGLRLAGASNEVR